VIETPAPAPNLLFVPGWPATSDRAWRRASRPRDEVAVDERSIRRDQLGPAPVPGELRPCAFLLPRW